MSRLASCCCGRARAAQAPMAVSGLAHSRVARCAAALGGWLPLRQSPPPSSRTAASAASSERSGPGAAAGPQQRRRAPSPRPRAIVGGDGAAMNVAPPPLADGVVCGAQNSSGGSGGGSSFGRAGMLEPWGWMPWQRAYPHIEQHFPGLQRVHDEPPVYIARGFLSDDDCQLLRQAAEAGQLQGLHYDNAVLLDTYRLWPLLLVVAAGSSFDCWHALQVGPGAAAAALTPDALAAAVGPALLRWAAGVGMLLGAALAAANWAVGGKVFTGTKWTAARLEPAHPTAPAFARFLARASCLLSVPPDRLEPPTITRYRRGQYQRIHFDARPDGDPAGFKQFLEAGGQRLVQVVTYLNSLSPTQGGGTHFYNPAFNGLTVQPKRGDALVFFPAFADGRFDERMAHAGLAVKSGEKWILNTWACQRPVPTSITHLLLPGATAVSGQQC